MRRQLTFQYIHELVQEISTFEMDQHILPNNLTTFLYSFVYLPLIVLIQYKILAFHVQSEFNEIVIHVKVTTTFCYVVTNL